MRTDENPPKTPKTDTSLNLSASSRGELLNGLELRLGDKSSFVFLTLRTSELWHLLQGTPWRVEQ